MRHYDLVKEINQTYGRMATIRRLTLDRSLVSTDKESTPEILLTSVIGDLAMRYLGVDLHRNSFTVAFRAEKGSERLKEYQLRRIGEFKRTLRTTDKVAVEATGNTRYFVSQICGRVEQVIVVDPNKFEVMKKSVNKTDENAAKALALFLSKDMLPKARLKTKEGAQISSLVGTRDKLVKLRTTLINKIHNILNSYGIKRKKESFPSDKGLDSVLKLGFDEIVMVELEVIVTQIKSLSDSIKKLDKEIEDRGKKLDGHKNLASIKGIGSKSATILLSVIGDVNDFTDEDKLSAYFGIVPRVSKSNQTEHHGRITKQGSKIGRTTLVQCTLIAKRYSPYLGLCIMSG